MHFQVYMYMCEHLYTPVYICIHVCTSMISGMLPVQTCMCPVGMSIHVHAYKYVSVCAEAPAGMGYSAQMLFSQRGQQRPDTFASKAQMRKWKVRERPDLPCHKASFLRLDSKSECVSLPEAIFLHPVASVRVHHL